MTAPLECIDVSMSYGGVHAIEDVSCTFLSGSISGVVGMNGAGKTTLMRVISQQVRGARGQVLIHGRNVMGMSDFRVVRLGLAKTYQNIQLFSGMTVRQNIAVGFAGRRGLGHVGLFPFRHGRTSYGAEVDEVVVAAAQSVGLAGHLEANVTSLSYGHRKRVEMARALATRPSVLLLDEPSSGLSQTEVDELADILTRLKTTVDTVVLVEHNFGLLFRTADRLLVLASGRTRFDGPISHFSRPDQVRELFAL